MNTIQFYSLPHINVQVDSENSQLKNKVYDALIDYFYLGSDSSPAHCQTLKMRFENNDGSFKVPQSARELFYSPSLKVVKEGHACFIIRGNSVMHLELTKNQGTGYLDSTFWQSSPKLKQEFLMLSFLWLLRSQKVYALHGNALVKDDVGFIFAGGSGSGKSTAALSLIRQGWRYLSDDVTLLGHFSQEIEAFAFTRGVSLDPAVAHRYEELKEPLKKSSLNGHKRFFDIISVYSDGFTPHCILKVLIFPQIVKNEKSRLIPLDRTKALILLIENSGGIMVDRDSAIEHIDFLKKLVQQTVPYQLFLGPDLYEEPEKISLLLPKDLF